MMPMVAGTSPKTLACGAIMEVSDLDDETSLKYLIIRCLKQWQNVSVFSTVLAHGWSISVCICKQCTG